jgi:hypothetical protein
VRLTERIERLEARAPKPLKRVGLVWVSPDGSTTKAADTHPHLPDDREYTSYLSPYRRGGGIDAPQAN